MAGWYAAYRREWAAVSPEIVDRVLIGLCVAVWLLLVGTSVAAIVALVDLGRGFHKMAGSPHTTWVLYAVIAVSAATIVAAIPMLLRARHQTPTEPAGAPAHETASHPAVDRIWLRGTVALVGTMGAALVAVGAATYLMAIGRDGASWAGYAIAGILTAAMPVIPWRHVRQLRATLAGHRPG